MNEYVPDDIGEDARGVEYQFDPIAEHLVELRVDAEADLRVPHLDVFREGVLTDDMLEDAILQARGHYSLHGHRELARDARLLSGYLAELLTERGLGHLLELDTFTQILTLLQDSVRLGEQGAFVDGIKRTLNGYTFFCAYAQVLYIFLAEAPDHH